MLCHSCKYKANPQTYIFTPPHFVIYSGICPIFSPSALVGGVRGRDSELAGGVIISKDKPPPASAKALAPPPEAEGEMIDDIFSLAFTFFATFYCIL